MIKIEEKYTFRQGNVTTIDDELSVFWRDRKFERYPHSPDNSPGLLLEQIRKSAKMLEYKINYKLYSIHVEDSDLLRSIIRIKELSDGRPELSLEIWRKKVQKITQEDDYIIQELGELEGITNREFAAFYEHLIESGYRLGKEEESLTNRVKETFVADSSQQGISKTYKLQRSSIRKMLKLIACREYRRKQRGIIFPWTHNPFGDSGRLREETANKIA